AGVSPAKHTTRLAEHNVLGCCADARHLRDRHHLRRVAVPLRLHALDALAHVCALGSRIWGCAHRTYALAHGACGPSARLRDGWLRCLEYPGDVADGVSMARAPT